MGFGRTKHKFRRDRESLLPCPCGKWTLDVGFQLFNFHSTPFWERTGWNLNGTGAKEKERNFPN